MEPDFIEKEQLGPAGFGKQRRNILLISVLLAAGLWVGVSFTPLSEITIFGNKILLSRTKGIEHIVWGVWLYFLIRYIAFHLRYQKSDQKFDYLFGLGINNLYQLYIHSVLLKQGKNPHEYQKEIVRLTFLGSLYIRMKKQNSTSWEDTYKLPISPMKISIARLKVLGRVLFRMPEISEFYLPYLVALLPVILVWIR